MVGYENHSGLTTLGPGASPFGTVRVGDGNNGKDSTVWASMRLIPGISWPLAVVKPCPKSW